MHGTSSSKFRSDPQDGSVAHLRPAAFSESVESYPHVRLNAGWRVIVCRDGLQWILQARNRAETVSRTDWRGRSYCRTREALIRCCDAYCGAIDPAAAATLSALPWCIGAAVDEPEPVAPVTAPKVARVPVKVLDSVARAYSRPNPIRANQVPAGASAMQEKYLQALARRVAQDPRGEVVLPTGPADAAEVAQVLWGIDRARESADDRC